MISMALTGALFAVSGTLSYADEKDDPVRSTSYGVTISVSSSGSAGGVSSAGSSVVPKCVREDGVEVACSGSAGWWNAEHQCYVKPEDPQPAKSDSVWQGRVDGVVMLCLSQGDIAVNRRGTRFWAPAERPVVDPGVVAQTAVERMGLSGIRVGMVPFPTEKAANAVGVVGQSVWLWVEAPDETTWGPITKSASAGGVSVTATARVEKVVWDMGDGHKVTCTTPGVVWSAGRGQNNQMSPECGYRYQKQGHYTVTATSYWRVDWAGLGRTGVIRLTRTTAVHNVIGEIHVLNR